MIGAIVLINSEKGKENLVLEETKLIPGVKEIFLVYGAYDIILRLEKDTKEELEKSVLDEIRAIKTVRATLTLYLVK